MKKALILLMFPILSFGQNYDSLKQSILKIQSDQNVIKMNLEKHRDQYNLGTSLAVGGALMMLVDLGIMQSSPEENNRTFSFIGAGTFVAGTVIQINSHKWIRAGKRKRK